jgi:site-specific DNA-methyltransferase (adenine-specific)
MEKNRIICGDAVKLIKKIPDESIDLVLTDPPYGINFRSNMGKVLKDRIKNDELSDARKLWKKIIPELIRVTKKDSEIYWFSGLGKTPVFIYNWQEFEKHKPKIQIKNILVWDKGYPGLGWDWRPQHEVIFQVVKGKGINKSTNKGRSNILKVNKIIPKADDHPTPKPVELIRKILIEKSNEDDIVFDPFMGGGSVAVACKENKRNFIGFEIDGKWVNLTYKKLARLNGNINN